MKHSRILLPAAALVLLIGGGLTLKQMLHRNAADEPLPVLVKLPDDEARRAFLEQYGCPAEPDTPIYSCPVTIPEHDSSSIYQAYRHLQMEQQLPFSTASGDTGTEYTYTISDTERAALLISEDGLLLAAIRYDSTQPQILLPVMTES